MTTGDSPLSVTPATTALPKFKVSLAKRYQLDRLFHWVALIATLIGLVVLAVLLFHIARSGLPQVGWSFISNFASRKPEQAGIYAAVIGTIWLMMVTAAIAFPFGVGAGIFLEEFAGDSWFTQTIEINIANLAAVPSIIYGLLGLEVFVRVMHPITGGRTILAGSLTMALLILPIIIVATREALRAIPDSLRQAGLALGATRWQLVREQILPLALPGILTGTILALSRAIGETAPLIVVGAVAYIRFLPNFWPLWVWNLDQVIAEGGEPGGLQTKFTVLPMQIYEWVSRPQAAFHDLAAGGIVVLMVLLLFMNAAAIFLRNKFQKSL